MKLGLCFLTVNLKEEILRIGDVMVDAEDLSALAATLVAFWLMLHVWGTVKNPCEKILIPCIYHVNGYPWGLLCLYMAQQQAFYDDSLKQGPPTNIIELADILLKAVTETQWNITFPIQRFVMPKQPLFGEGCASSGIGVILAVFGFIDNPADNGIPHFQWSFHGMESDRQRLLYRFTQWK